MTVTSPLGAVLRDEQGMRLEFVRTFPDPIERVWSALTEPEQLAVWFGTWRGDPSTGTIEVAPIEGDGEFAPAELVECEPPHRLSIVLPSDDGPWPLSVRLDDAEGVTTLVFVHRLAEPYDATSIGPGWQYYLDRLEATVHATPMPEGEDWPGYEALGERYPLPD